MLLGKIISSESHLQYHCQIFTQGEVAAVPEAEEYGLGTYVTIPVSNGRSLVGIIYDTVLHNPAFGSLGPRLSSDDELAIFSPDYLSEVAVLVNVIVVGSVLADGRAFQDAPEVAATVNASVHRMEDEDILAFHMDGDEVRLGYLPLLISLARTAPVMTHTILKVIEKLQTLFPDGQASMRLRLVRQNLSWQFRVLSMP
ncbi:MAG: hypothetical protein ACYC5O_10545 [Anaerolineae bacterium]